MSAKRVRVALLAVGWALFAPVLAGAQTLPRPAYDNTFYALVYGLRVSAADGFDPEADAVLERVQPGPYAKVGLADYFALDMPWVASPATAPLTAPSEELLRSLAERSRARGLVFHVSALGGVSRAVEVYAAAKREDRRNAQWFKSGAIVPPQFTGTADGQLAAAYVTPSRYARKLRRHLEAKVRAFARRMLALRETYPDTLATVSGDAEAELNSEAENPSLAYDDQLIADYSPFAILEFRDWLLHTGLYADDGPYAGDGYQKRPGDAFEQGPGALSGANLAKFDGQFWTPFGTWDLKYFHWSLSDPVDGDPRALSAARTAAGWSAVPTSGPDFIGHGFDAPRYRFQYNPALWDLWLEFRATMLANYARDFAAWMTTTPGAHGEKLEPSRWYSHQIPGDYLNGRRPGSPDPERRLITSASPFWTALVGEDVGTPGVTVLDRRERGASGLPVYERTSEHLFGAIAALDLPSWGMPEYSPSWHIDVGPETSLSTLVAQYARAYQAGAHMLAFTPWPHFTDTLNGDALGDFVDRIKFEPIGSVKTAYLAPAVHGVAGEATQTLASLRWSPQVFADVAGFDWSQWPRFRQFEVWRGATADFTTSSGKLVRSATGTSADRIPLTSSARYYKVLAVTRDLRRGALSGALLVEPNSAGVPVGGPEPEPSPEPTPAPTPGGGGGGGGGGGPQLFRSCRLFDSRYGTDPALAAGTRTAIDVGGRCGIPESASAVLVTVYVFAPAENGAIDVYPGTDAASPATLSFTARRSSTSKLQLRLADDGSIALDNRAPMEPVDVMVLAYGYLP